MYDLTGSVEDSEELAGGAFGELYNYYRSIFKEVSGLKSGLKSVWAQARRSLAGSSSCCCRPVDPTPPPLPASSTINQPTKQVTEDDVESFHESFRGSEEERGEVLQYYQRFKGDMGQVGWALAC